MKYYLIAGEASGDLHASHLMQALKARDAAAEFRFYGGDLMAAVGGTRVKHYRELAYMGFIPVLLHLPTILRNMRLCKQDIVAWQPDVVILIDYPGFNLKIAQYVHANKLCPVYYYISPKIWAWKEYRIKNIKRDVDELFSILPFEVPFFEEKHHYPIHYVGNPTAQEVRDFLATDKHGLARTSEKPIIALLAGSRKQEITAILPQMLKMIPLFPQYQFVVSVVSWQPKSLYDKYLKNCDVTPVEGSAYPMLANAKAAIVASGTATLETAMIGTPQVVCYAGSEISYLIAKQLISGIQYISLVNLIMDKKVVTELIQHDYTTQHLRDELRLITDDADNIARIKEDYRQLDTLLGDGSASAKAADVVIELAKR